MNPVRRNVIASYAGRVATALLWVVVTPWVLRQLGPEGFGVWALFFAFTGYLVALDLGVGSTMIRFISAGRAAGDRGALEHTLSRGLRMALALGLFWGIVIVLLRGWIVHAFRVPATMVPETLSALLVFAVGVTLTFPAQVLTGSLQGFERLDLSNTCMLAGVVVHVLGLCVALWLNGGLLGVAAAGACGQAVSALSAALMLRVLLRRSRSGQLGVPPAWRDLVHFGAALQLTGVLIVLQWQAGKLLVGLLTNLGNVADYELAFRVAGGLGNLPVLILAAVVPAASRMMESDGPGAVAALYTSTLRWLYVQSVVVLGLLWLLAGDLTHVWLGPGYERIAQLIRLWVVVYMVNLGWGPGAAVARGIGRPWIEVWSFGVSLVANVGLAYAWIPRWGNAGAIAALAASYGAGFATYVIAARRGGVRFGPWIRREYVPRVIAGWVAVAACGALVSAQPLAARLPGPGWVHAVVVGVAFVPVFALCFLPLGDTQRLWGVLRKTFGVVRGRRREAGAS